MEDILHSRIRSRKAVSVHSKYLSLSHQQGKETLKVLSQSLQRQQKSQKVNQPIFQHTESRFQLVQPKHISYVSNMGQSTNSQSPDKSTISPLRARINQSRILKSSLQNSRISPENRIMFKQKLSKINQSIQYIQERQNEQNGISSNCYINMCAMINKTEYDTVTVQPEPLIKLIKPESTKNVNDLVQKIANQVSWSETRKRQRSKLEQSVYYKTNKWTKAKKQKLQCFNINNTIYQKKNIITQLKIPYLRHNSKQMFMAVKQKNYQQLLKHLSHNKSYIHEVDKCLMTPLHISCQLGLYDITKLLLRFKSDVNAIDSNKKTPLYYALFNGHVELVKMLLIHDAFPYSDQYCNYTQFFANKTMKELFRVAKRIFTLILICPKQKRKQMKEFLEINFLSEYTLPNTLLN